jgi:hypothetical protein
MAAFYDVGAAHCTASTTLYPLPSSSYTISSTSIILATMIITPPASHDAHQPIYVIFRRRPDSQQKQQLTKKVKNGKLDYSFSYYYYFTS